jgi:sugar lactone lactonase YvrE
MRLRASGAALAVLALALSCHAQGTQLWKQSRAEDFDKGTSHGIAIRSDGMLTLAPATKLITTSASTYLWGLASDEQGNALIAAGSPARLYEVGRDGKPVILFEGKELQAQTVVTDRAGSIYFATSPDGRVYKIPASARANPTGNAATVFFEPKSKYIWALALDKAGNLFVATGDGGEIYKVDPSGNGAIFFNSDELHIRSLAFDPQGNLIAGSDGSGLIYRIDAKGQGFVLFSAPKKEVTALAIDGRGNIYAASVGEKRPSGAATNGGAAPAAPTGGSEVDLITPDGSPARLWTSKEDLVYALAFDARGRVLIGTGNRGKVYAVADDGPTGQYTTLLTLAANQITAFAPGPNGGLFAATSNLGKLMSIAPYPASDGTFESDVFDAKTFARWGRVEVHGRGKYEIAMRTGNVDNPERNWSNWTKIDLSGNTAPDLPLARFAQWRATFYPRAEIDSVAVNYRPKNIAPALDDVSVTLAPRPNITPAINDLTVKWTAHDDNNDELRYSIFYRGTGEERWNLLRDKIKDKQLVLDPSLFPDGEYQIRVLVTDAPSHSPEDAHTAERVSNFFEVDSTPPRIDSLQAVNDNSVLHISFRAADNYSPIKRAEYSLDAGEWQVIEPVGAISDAKTETYDFDTLVRSNSREDQSEDASAQAPARDRRGKQKSQASIPVTPDEHLVVVRVYDRFDNMATAKYVVRGGAHANAQR